MARPVQYDLTAQPFGALMVLGRSNKEPSKWACQCECGKQVLFKTEQLRWQNKRDCGCGRGKDRTAKMAGASSAYKASDDLIDLVPQLVLQSLGCADNRPCSICQLVPARRIMPVYRIQDLRFIDGRNDVASYLTLCSVCYSIARELKLHLVSSVSPDRWFMVANARFGDRPSKFPGLRDMANLVLTTQTEDEQRSLSGAETRRQAEEIMQHE